MQGIAGEARTNLFFYEHASVDRQAETYTAGIGCSLKNLPGGAIDVWDVWREVVFDDDNEIGSTVNLVIAKAIAATVSNL